MTMTGIAESAFSSFPALSHSGVAVEANFHLIQLIRNDGLGLCVDVSEFLCFAVEGSLGSDTKKIVGEYSFQSWRSLVS